MDDFSSFSLLLDKILIPKKVRSIQTYIISKIKF